MMKNAWKPTMSVSPVAMRREKSERAVWATRKPGADEEDVGEHDGDSADQAHLGADGREDHVVVSSGI